jgi:selenoprotein W-related protein
LAATALLSGTYRALGVARSSRSNTFGTDLGEVALSPGTGGVFDITYDGTTIWERKADGGFPDAKTLKQRVRDRLDSGRDLGHIDRGTGVKGGANGD